MIAPASFWSRRKKRPGLRFHFALFSHKRKERKRGFAFAPKSASSLLVSGKAQKYSPQAKFPSPSSRRVDSLLTLLQIARGYGIIESAAQNKTAPFVKRKARFWSWW
ncbi:MAG: hypothetical protein J6Z04_02185 [Clostridia bacterium]|nr:hypothetical protein [Clostridia bacterium]